MEPDRIAEQLAAQVRELLADAQARAVEIVSDAEAEAETIRIAAEADADGIRARADDEATRRLDEVREALDVLHGRLSQAAMPSPEGEVEPGPVIVPEPGPTPVPEPTPQPTPEPSPPSIPEPAPPPDEADPPSPEPSPGPPAPPEPSPEPPSPGSPSPPAPGGPQISTEELLERLKAGARNGAAASESGATDEDAGGVAEAGNATDKAAARLVAMQMALDGVSRGEIESHIAANYDVPNREKLLDDVLARAKA